MAWGEAAALWLGLAVPAILALWLLRPRRPRRRVPSLLLWPASPAERQAVRPWQRLRNHPLLWLQLVAAVLLALAAARPFLPASAAGRHLVVVLDASGSMRARVSGADGAGGDRFEAARAAVVELARGLGPGQDMAVIRLDDQPRVLVAEATDAAQVEAALAGEAAAYGPADVAAGLALAAGLSQGLGAAEWVLVSDGALQIPERVRRPAGTSYRFVAVGQPAANVAVTGLAARQGERGLTLQATLRNTGDAAVSGRLQLLAEDQITGAQEWRLEAGGETFVTWSDLAGSPEAGAPASGTAGTAGAAGPRWYEARLAGVDAGANFLAHDDRAWVAPAVAEMPSVLLVSTGNVFVERALAVQGQVRAFRAAPADWPGTAGAAAGAAASGTAYPLTILDRLWPAALPAGNVLVVGPPVGAEFQPQAVLPRPDHPLLRHVDWSDVRVGAARRVPLDTGWETVIDSDGGPLLAIRTEGGSRQAVLAFDLSRSDLALRPAFPILMANLLEWLLPRPEGAPRTVAPGGAIRIDPAALAQEAWVEAIDGAGRGITGRTGGSAGGAPPGGPGAGQTGTAGAGGAGTGSTSAAGTGGKRVDLAPPWPPRPFRPEVPGLYRVVQAGDGMRQELTLVAEGYHPSEADLRLGAPAIPAAAGEAAPAARGALAFWPWLVAAVVLLSTVEWWVDARGR